MFDIFKKNREKKEELLKIKIKTLENRIDALINGDKYDDGTKLLRNNLASIDPSDYKETLTENERKEMAAIIASSYRQVGKILSDLLTIQKEFAIRESQSWEQVLVSRGTINGIALIAEKLSSYKDEHIRNVLEAQNRNGK